MAAPAVTYTQRTDFGVSNGPTFSGTTVVPDTGLGTENFRVYSASALNTINTTIDAVGFLVANLVAFGFKMSVDPVQSGAPTPAELAAATVDVVMLNVLTGAPFTMTLVVGEAVSFPAVPATFDTDCGSIHVLGDTVVDCVVEGLILLSA